MTKRVYINEVMDGKAVLVCGDIRSDYIYKQPDEDVEINIGGIIYSLKKIYEVMNKRINGETEKDV